MKKIVAVGLAAALALIVLAQWHAHRVATATARTSSQIYIHGTPVCISLDGVEIVAKVGECGNTREGGEGGFEGRAPFHGSPAPFHGPPGMRLPPGHPPVDPEVSPPGRRRVLI